MGNTPHVLISALLCLLSCSPPPTCHSPVLLGSGPLSLEPVRHRQEAVAHQHRDQSHDLRPLLDSSEAQHRRTQGEKRPRCSLQMTKCVCVCVCENLFAGLCRTVRMCHRELVLHLGVQSLHPDAERRLSGRFYMSFSGMSETFPKFPAAFHWTQLRKRCSFSLSHSNHVILPQPDSSIHGTLLFGSTRPWAAHSPGRCLVDMDTHMLPFHELLCDLIHSDF